MKNMSESQLTNQSLESDFQWLPANLVKLPFQATQSSKFTFMSFLRQMESHLVTKKMILGCAQGSKTFGLKFNLRFAISFRI
jgi:hypothetical protein